MRRRLPFGLCILVPWLALTALGCDTSSRSAADASGGANQGGQSNAGGGQSNAAGGTSSLGALALRGVNLSCAEWGQKFPGTYGVDYTYPTHAEVDYFLGKGMTALRLPFAWERLQRTLTGDFDEMEQGRIDDFVAYATGQGAYVILDPHNYARYAGIAIGQAGGPSDEQFADLWAKLAALHANNPRVVFGLMNEPHDIAVNVWLSAANAAVIAIREAGADNLILVPGTNWTGAASWLSSNTAMLGISDPLNHYAFEVHQYTDADSSGTHAECVSTTIGSQRLQSFTSWLETQGKLGFLGEFMGPDNPTCLGALDDMLSFIDRHANVWVGWTYWAAGPWWGPQPDTNASVIEPRGAEDAPQMAVLAPHL